MLDWVQTFIEKFGHYPEIKNLATTNFHGSLTINFSNGIPHNYDLKLHRRAESSISTEPKQ